MLNTFDPFSNLKNLGFSDLGDLSLFNDKSKDEKKQNVTSQPTTQDCIYERKVECPVCYNQISIRSVKTSCIRVLSKDSDFMQYYKDPNPMFYDAWVCLKCGYAALSSKFNIISEKQKKLIKENITTKLKPNRTYPAVYDIDTAIEMHQLALLNTTIKIGRDSEKAFICLKLAWLYRLKKDENTEYAFLFQALKGFLMAYENESPPIAGLDESSLEYLIGELYRKLDNDSCALKWFSKVLYNPNAKAKIKDMARDQKEYIRELQNKDIGKFFL